MNSCLTPIHSIELSQNMGYTAYGIIVQNADDITGKVFDNNGSRITLDYDDLIEKNYDEYQSSHINKNQLACPLTRFPNLLNRFSM